MITIQANNFPIYTIESGAVFEPLYLPPDGSRTKYPIGWLGLGRYEAGSLRIWKNGISLNPLSAFAEEANGVFFNFAAAPPATDSYNDYLVSYVPRAADLAFALGSAGSTYAGEEYFFVPNWINDDGCGDGFWVGRYQAARNCDKHRRGRGNHPGIKSGRHSLVLRHVHHGAGAGRSKGNRVPLNPQPRMGERSTVGAAA